MSDVSSACVDDLVLCSKSCLEGVCVILRPIACCDDANSGVE